MKLWCAFILLFFFFQATENNLRLEIRNLNLERAALLDTIAKLQALIPDNVLSNASLDLIQPKTDLKCYDSESSLQTIESTAPGGGGDNLSIDNDSIDGEVAAINKVHILKEERSRNNSGGSIGSGQSASTNTSEADVPCIMITDTKSISSLWKWAIEKGFRTNKLRSLKEESLRNNSRGSIGSGESANTNMSEADGAMHND